MKKYAKLDKEQSDSLLQILQTRFEKNMNRHEGLQWNTVKNKLLQNNSKLWSLNEMEITGGEPDVVDYNELKDEYTFTDCSAESPSGRRSLCYDLLALELRKENKPKHSALGMAAEMGIAILDETQYRALQKLGKFDSKTSSWMLTPKSIRDLGGAIFGDYRYGTVFTYHNGAESYYAARGFRGSLKV